MEIRYHKKAIKVLRTYDEVTVLRMMEQIQKLANDEPNVDIAPLMPDKMFYRLRMGKYRIVFHKNDNELLIMDIDTRGQIYK
jgi:mRNA interferase RelE/StbE